MMKIKKYILFIITILLLFIPEIKGQCKNVVVVIDPGHGGEALGGNMDDRAEREIDLITGMAMKERLEQYEGVEVYLTRDNCTDKELTRKQRFEIARKVNADYLYSIHYNMSENHTLFGSEVWIGSQGKFYTSGYAFANILMQDFRDFGVFDRGIKNKLDKNKSGEYYGILKYAEEFKIPAVIIEHCHLDEERDSVYWNEEAYKRFGEIDADAVAKFYHLSSAALGIDNSEYDYYIPEAPANRLDRDETPPEYCSVEIIGNDDNYAECKISSVDNDTYVQYYSYSIDGGISWSRLEAWEDRTSEEQYFNVELLEGKEAKLKVRVYNQYEEMMDSDIVILPMKVIPVIDEEENIVKQQEYDLIDIQEHTKNETQISPVFVFFICFIISLIIFNIVLVIYITNSRKKKKKRRKKKTNN